MEGDKIFLYWRITGGGRGGNVYVTCTVPEFGTGVLEPYQIK